MADDIVFSASLDDTDILNALDDIATEIKDLARIADRQFDTIEDAVFDILDATKAMEKGFDKAGRGIGNTSKLSGVKLGTVSGIVQSLTTEFINLGKQAVQSLIEVSKEAVNIATGYETLEARLLGIFDGSQEAASEAFDFIQDRSKQLGVDLSELAGAFIPQVESLDQFERVAKIATALARSDPEAGIIGARVSLIEALSGSFRSLQQRFEFTDEQIGRIQDAFDTEGIEGFLSTLETVLAESGKSFDDFAGTAGASFDRAKIQGQQLLGVLGDPILEELKDQFDAVGQVVSENADDFELIATAVGQLVANVVKFVGTNLADFLQNLDRDQILGIVEDFQSMFESAKNLSQVLQLTEIPQKLLKGVALLVEGLDKALITAVQLSVLAKAENAKADARFAKAKEVGGSLGILSGLNTEEQDTAIAEAGQEAYNQVIREAVDIFDENKQITDAYAQSLADLADAQQNAGDATTDTADALLAQRQAAKDAAEGLSEETIKALDKLNDLERDAFRSRIDIIRKAGQKAADTEEEFIQKRIDIFRDARRKLEDAYRKNEQAITDSGTDLRRDEEDALRDFNRKRAEIEKDSAKERIKVEEDYRDEIRRINQNFADSADEAARMGDAVTFFRLQRERDRQIKEAKITRTKRVDETKTEASEKRAELNLSYQQQLEDARIADNRRLEDLQIRLQREFESARINRERDFENLRISEERKNEELARSLKRQEAEARISNNRRVFDFKESLDAEVRAQVEAEQKKTEVVRQQSAKRSSIYQQQIDEAQKSASKFSVPDYLRRPGRQRGGPVGAGQVVPVGEAGPELFQPSIAGNIIPLGPGITSPLAAQNISSVINNVTNASVNQSMLDPSQQSAMMRAIAANVASETVRRIISG